MIGGILQGIGGITGGLIGGIGGLVQGKKNREAQQAINAQNLAIMQSENAIMRQREDNAVQRKAADLEKAGINPLLAGLGQGAQAGAGQLIPMQAPLSTVDWSAIGQNITNASHDFYKGARTKAEAEHTKEDVLNLAKQRDKIDAEIAMADEQTKLIREQIKKTGSEILLMASEKEFVETGTLEKFANINLLTEKTNLTKLEQDLTEAQKAQLVAQIANLETSNWKMEKDVQIAVKKLELDGVKDPIGALYMLAENIGFDKTKTKINEYINKLKKKFTKKTTTRKTQSGKTVGGDGRKF